jgi:hypothetical protein
MTKNIFCSIKENSFLINLTEDRQSILVEMPEDIHQKINCAVKENTFNFRLSPIETFIRVNIAGGLKGEEGHTHPNKEMLDSLRYDAAYQCYLLKDN